MKIPSNVTIAAGLLAVVTFVTFAPVLDACFIAYDDPDYVTQNPHVSAGLTKAGILWAFTELRGENTYWHPVTWLSHMADCQLFGLNAEAHHAVNMVLHAVNVVLLFLLLRRLTGASGRSAIVAALFALHPLQVDTVAWVTERKNLLSALFFLLTLWAYVGYVGKSKVHSPKSKVFYGLSLGLFALGLMSKPSVVTLPCVLLLLDYWPLGRFEFKTQDSRLKSAFTLLLEKFPFFALSLAACAVTYLSQRASGAVSSLERMPLGLRLSNALVSYGRYLRKTFWPDDLAVFYPYPKSWPVTYVLLAAALVLGISAWVVCRRKRQPYLLVGWCWFVGMLVPTIGLIQAGAQSMADRFAYLPLIGLFLLIVWGVSEWRRGHPQQPALMAGCVVVVVAGCVVATRAQLGYWQNSLALFERALAVTPANAVSLTGLGNALEGRGRMDEAMERYRQALELSPEDARANYNLANCLFQKKRLTEAATYYERALVSAPNATRTHNNLAVVLAQLGRADEAARHFRKVLASEPDNAKVQYNLGLALRELEDAPEAARHFAEAVQLEPQDARARYDLALALLDAGQEDRSRAQLRQALTLQPALLTEINNRAWMLATRAEASARDGQKAIVLASAALKYSGPRRSWVLDTLAAAHAEVGQFAAATNYAQQALSLARLADDPMLAEEISHRLELYQQGQRYREPPRKP